MEADGGAMRRSLSVLELEHNKITVDGVRALARCWLRGVAEGGGGITELRLKGNTVGEEGAKALASVVEKGALPRLQRLCVGGNRCGRVGGEGLWRALGGQDPPAVAAMNEFEVRTIKRAFA
jgi:Ran GTPase-activating protein (RanGAP) involved in mRNA processing and transport